MILECISILVLVLPASLENPVNFWLSKGKKDDSFQFRYLPGKTSFLEYMLNLVESSDGQKASTFDLVRECRRKNYAFTIYNKVVYVYACGCDSSSFEELCGISKLDVPSIRNKSLLREGCKKNQENWKKLVQTSDEQVEVACKAVVSYLRKRQKLDMLSKRNNRTFKLMYKEKVVEDLPFCQPFSCPYWESNLTEFEPVSTDLYHCMSSACKSAFWAILLIDVSFALTIIGANITIIIVILKTPYLLTPHGRFMLSLASADVIVGFVTEPFIVFNLLLRYKSGLASVEGDDQWYVNLSGFFTALSLAASLLSLIGTSLFRFFAIVRPRWYWRHRCQVSRAAIVFIVAIWITSGALGLLPLLRIIPDDRYFVHPVGITLSQQLERHFMYVGTLCFGLTVIWGFTFASYVVVKRKKEEKKRRRQSNSLAPVSGSQSNSRLKKMENSLSRTLRLVVIVFTVCYLPLVVTQSFSKLKSIHLHSYPGAFNARLNTAWNASMYFSSRLVLANSFANCVIYSATNKDFLSAAKKIVFPAHLKSTR